MNALLIWYPKCSTCQKAKAWLDEHGVACETRHIVEETPAAAELAQWHARSGLPLKRFFNTSG
ncbi:glutaredoxin domain-containing protein, partial [Eubacterium callanderi]|uniref:glutaredoxin domain-containing protein n=1 Tax=Eubacterium callanderi TaxID=53442 RepID=UPI002441481A